MEYFSTQELFRIGDHKVPLQTEHAIRGLMASFESLFPDARMPRDRQEALACLDLKLRPTLRMLPVAKKDWIEWTCEEMQLRLWMAARFLNLRARAESKERLPPVVLFLREFRAVRHKEFDGIGCDIMRGGEGVDVELREYIEKMFSDCSVFWLANPKDALCYSIGVEIPANTYPYIASEDWLECVRVLANSADLIVMANTKRGAAKGTFQELDLLRSAGLLDKTFFSNPSELEPIRVNCIKELTRDCLGAPAFGRYGAILQLPLFKHWAGFESNAYAANYVGAIDQFWGDIQDTGREVGGDVFAAIFMAISVLALFRGKLAAAAKLHTCLARAIARDSGNFPLIDLFAVPALFKSANWYAANAELFGDVYGIAFTDQL